MSDVPQFSTLKFYHYTLALITRFVNKLLYTRRNND